MVGKISSELFSQTDCRTYSNNGILNFANRVQYKEVNSQANFNKNGTINAVPIVSYHSIDNKKTTASMI